MAQADTGNRTIDLDVPRGLSVFSVGLWLALAAAVLALTAVGADFYRVGENVRDAWMGIPHTTQLVLLAGLTPVVLAGLAAAGRSPVRGRTLGAIIGLVGLIATVQLVYRMAVPPFGGCLTYNCAFAPKKEVALLLGIWIALAGTVGVTLGGFFHAMSSAAKRTPANFWLAPRQTGMAPWLGLAALSAAAMFVIGYTWFDFYTVVQGEETTEWSAWLAIPHTAGLVLLIVLAIVGLAVAAARGRAPMGAAAMGATIAVLAFVATARTLYRIIVPPFYSGPAEGVFEQGAQINLPAYIALAFGALTIVSGIVYAARNRESVPESSAARSEPARVR